MDTNASTVRIEFCGICRGYCLESYAKEVLLGQDTFKVCKECMDKMKDGETVFRPEEE